MASSVGMPPAPGQVPQPPVVQGSRQPQTSAPSLNVAPGGYAGQQASTASYSAPSSSNGQSGSYVGPSSGGSFVVGPYVPMTSTGPATVPVRRPEPAQPSEADVASASSQLVRDLEDAQDRIKELQAQLEAAQNQAAEAEDLAVEAREEAEQARAAAADAQDALAESRGETEQVRKDASDAEKDLKAKLRQVEGRLLATEERMHKLEEQNTSLQRQLTEAQRTGSRSALLEPAQIMVESSSEQAALTDRRRESDDRGLVSSPSPDAEEEDTRRETARRGTAGTRRSSANAGEKSQQKPGVQSARSGISATFESKSRASDGKAPAPKRLHSKGSRPKPKSSAPKPGRKDPGEKGVDDDGPVFKDYSTMLKGDRSLAELDFEQMEKIAAAL